MTLATYRLTPSRCPWCGYEVDAATETFDDKHHHPKAGDVTICIECGEWAVFKKPLLMLRKPTDKEFAYIAADFGCRKLRWAWMEMQKEIKP